jgi:hypothetical protein
MLHITIPLSSSVFSITSGSQDSMIRWLLAGMSVRMTSKDLNLYLARIRKESRCCTPRRCILAGMVFAATLAVKIGDTLIVLYFGRARLASLAHLVTHSGEGLAGFHGSSSYH